MVVAVVDGSLVLMMASKGKNYQELEATHKSPCHWMIVF